MPVMLRTIVGRIEKRSGVSSASVKAVLDALQYEILQTLADGNSVRLGDLGSELSSYVTGQVIQVDGGMNM